VNVSVSVRSTLSVSTCVDPPPPPTLPTLPPNTQHGKRPVVNGTCCVESLTLLYRATHEVSVIQCTCTIQTLSSAVARMTMTLAIANKQTAIANKRNGHCKQTNKQTSSHRAYSSCGSQAMSRSGIQPASAEVVSVPFPSPSVSQACHPLATSSPAIHRAVTGIARWRRNLATARSL
jgi:hypothetical protein